MNEQIKRWLCGTRAVCLGLFLCFVLGGCGHKEESHKEEHKEDGHKKKDEGGHKDAKKKEPVERPPSIVVHLRMDLDHELREEKVAAMIAEKVVGVPMPKPAGKEEAERAPVVLFPEEDTRYKTDKEYLALRRIEQPEKSKALGKAPAGEKDGWNTIEVRERSLVLGGKGFNMHGVEAEDNITIDSKRYWEDVPPPAPPKKEPEPLDLKEGDVRNKRNLIFHERGTGFFKTEEFEAKEEKSKAPQPKVAPSPIQKIPETKLRLSQGAGKELTLLPREGGDIDLLMGNEEGNRKLYGNR